MTFESTLRSEIAQAILELYQTQQDDLVIQPTNREFEGSHTLVCFPLTRVVRQKPEEIGKAIGEHLVRNSSLVKAYNVVKGFLNLTLSDKVWVDALVSIHQHPHFGQLPDRGEEIMIEYSSPNTNKPLHLGHLRNNFLGWSVAEIYKANGYTVHKVQIINDRGIHICKSMAAWQLYGEGETPESSGLKGDHLVGKYYVTFDKAYKAQVNALMEKGATEEEAAREAPVMKLATEMLRRWEQKDPEILELWRTMNGWVYEGFDATYRNMGVDFDKLYYESDTYLLGREEVLKGLERGVFFRKDDGSVWVDLTGDGLDQKLLLRSDGTSVYMTQDIGTAILRFRDFPGIKGQVYTVGNEQEYHFKVLFLILEKLGYDWARRCYHLSYGMVDLPSGRMKSREGTVVDADDLIEEMVTEAEKQTRELGKLDDVSDDAARKLFRDIGLGALKFFLLKVDPKKRMLFDPNESIQLQGFTGPFVQYTHARIKSVLRKAATLDRHPQLETARQATALEPAEREVLRLLVSFENKIREAARDYSPAVIANYVYDLAKEYNQFYQTIPIFAEDDEAKLHFRLILSATVADVIRRGMRLLGIEVPEKM
jgi:arginyl-tRNA synthetase